MEIIAYSKYVRMSARKLRLVASAVKSLTLDKAILRLPFFEKKGAQPIFKTLQSCIANAVNNFKVKKEDLKIKNIIIEETGRIKRMDKSHGARFNRGIIQKRTSHIKVILTSK